MRDSDIDPIITELINLLPLSSMLGKFSMARQELIDNIPEELDEVSSPDVLNVAPEFPSDSEGLQGHAQKYKNVNGPEYIRKVGETKLKEIDGDNITNEIFNEIGDFDLIDEQIPNHSKKTKIPY